MKRQICTVALGFASVLLATETEAAPRSMDECRTLSDPTARLACYDEVAGVAPAAQAPAPAVQPPGPAAQPSFQSRATPPVAQQQAAAPARTQAAPAELKKRSDFDSRLTAVVPLRHGYYRLELEDGTAYETTAVAPPPAAGEAVHIRRTFVGTTYLDMKGRSPIAIRLARVQ